MPSNPTANVGCASAHHLRHCGVLTHTLLLLFCCTTLLAHPIPTEKRIPATRRSTLTAPDKDPMHMPTDVAVDSKLRVFVADGANDRILQFAPDGHLEQTLTDPGNQKLNRPIGLAIDSSDQLWIADTANHRLLVLSPDGLKATPITAPKLDESSAPPDPTDIAITPDGRRTYIVDNKHHRILIRDNQTFKWTALGEPGKALGQFQYPFMITVGPENYVYVTEAVGARVQLISPAGRLAGQLGQWGVELGHFYRPKGIAADPTGRIFVSDSTLGVIQVFSPRGTTEGVLTSNDGRPLRFQHPMGMCFDKTGRLYVTELKANRVAIVSLKPEKK
ncbi:MAG: NHL repeat-containing protein [Planctomycetota bacterium]|nr:NHL repeat-containing protein [Planctomycetota bacterium]